MHGAIFETQAATWHTVTISAVSKHVELGS